MTDENRAGQGLQRLRSRLEDKYGIDRAVSGRPNREEAVSFSPRVEEELTPSRRQEILERVEALRPWVQGPFFLGGDVIIDGVWRKDRRWRELRAQIPDDLSGLRVLDVGTNAGFDSFMFKKLGAAQVVGVEPSVFYEQAAFLESIYSTGAEFWRMGWQQLDPTTHGAFDLIHCNGLLYHELHPLLLLQRLRAMVRTGGTLILGSMTLAEHEFDEYMRFVPDQFWGDPSWWWVPGPGALRSMLAASGFEVEGEFAATNGPPGHFPVLNRSWRARASDPASIQSSQVEALESSDG